jgi:hypothetical protein
MHLGRQRRRKTAFSTPAVEPLLAGRRHCRDSTERLLKDIQQPVMRQGPLWIVEPPLSTGERMSVNDP